VSFSDLKILDWVLIGALVALFVAQVYWYSRYMAAVARRIRKDKKMRTDSQLSPTDAPGVSVILCAHNERENLSNYLQALLTQNYPTYEVIVVDDGSEDDTRAIIERYMVQDPRLHMTFVPYGARVLSTKKLALTLAAKAAQYEYLLLTDADCVPESNRWISEMIQPLLKEGKEISLGFGAYFEEKGHINRLVRFDTLFNGLHYLGAAICGHPYMGVGRNLAYRKSLFFESGGFTHMMNNKAGDDDLFVNHVATKRNTAVVVSRDSYTWSLAKKTMKEWWQQKRRHLSVSPNYRTATKIRLAMEPLTRGLFYAAVIVTVVFAVVNYELKMMNPAFGMAELLLSVAIGLFLLRWIFQTIILNVSARRMGLKRFHMISVLWFDIVLPLVSLWMLVVPKRQTKW
jgi:cellulose synthase/poly-beta-1,6-N-acetylglucosamine synthase-like glycosyltransferase